MSAGIVAALAVWHALGPGRIWFIWREVLEAHDKLHPWQRSGKEYEAFQVRLLDLFRLQDWTGQNINGCELVRARTVEGEAVHIAAFHPSTSDGVVVCPPPLVLLRISATGRLLDKTPYLPPATCGLSVVVRPGQGPLGSDLLCVFAGAYQCGLYVSRAGFIYAGRRSADELSVPVPAATLGGCQPLGREGRDQETRGALSWVLGQELDQGDQLAASLNALRHRDGEVRALAVSSLAWNDGLVCWMFGMLQDPAAVVRAAAARTLAARDDWADFADSIARGESDRRVRWHFWSAALESSEGSDSTERAVVELLKEDDLPRFIWDMVATCQVNSESISDEIANEVLRLAQRWASGEARPVWKDVHSAEGILSDAAQVLSFASSEWKLENRVDMLRIGSVAPAQ